MIPHRKRPCAHDPFRADVTGLTHTFGNLADYAAGTIGSPGAECPLGQPMFACHMSPADPPELCAGWLAVAGYGHIAVRLAIAWGELPKSVLDPGEDWPPMFGTYEEAAAANAAVLDGLADDD